MCDIIEQVIFSPVNPVFSAHLWELINIDEVLVLQVGHVLQAVVLFHRDLLNIFQLQYLGFLPLVRV